MASPTTLNPPPPPYEHHLQLPTADTIATRMTPEGENKLELPPTASVPKNNGADKAVDTTTSMSAATHAHGGLGDSDDPLSVVSGMLPTKLAYGAAGDDSTRTPSPPCSLAPLSPLALPSTSPTASDSDLEWTTPSGSPLSATAPAPPHLVFPSPLPGTISLDELRSLPRESLVHWPAVTRANGHTVIHRAVPVEVGSTPKTASERGSRGRREGWDDGNKEGGERESGSGSESGGGGGVSVATGQAADLVDAHERARALSTAPPSVYTDGGTRTTTSTGASTPQPAIFGPDVAALLAARLVCQSPLTALAFGAASPMPTPGLTSATATAPPLFPVPDSDGRPGTSTPSPSSPRRARRSPPRTPHSPRAHTPRSPSSRRPSASLPEAWWAPAPSVRAALWAVLDGGDDDDDDDDDDPANAEPRGVVTWGEGGAFNTRCLGAFVFAPPFTPEEVAGLVASTAGVKAAPTSRRPSITTLGHGSGHGRQESCHGHGPGGGGYGHGGHGYSRSLSSLTAFSPVHAAFIPVGPGPPTGSAAGAGVGSSNNGGANATMVDAGVDATSTALTNASNTIPPTAARAPRRLDLAVLHKPLPDTPVGTAPSSPTTSRPTATPPQLTRSHTARALTTRLNRNHPAPEPVATGPPPLSTTQQPLPPSPSPPSPPTPPPPVQRPRRATLSAFGSGLGLFGFGKNNNRAQ